MVVLLMMCHFHYLPYPCLLSLGFRSFVASVADCRRIASYLLVHFQNFVLSEMSCCRFFRREENLGCDDLRFFCVVLNDFVLFNTLLNWNVLQKLNFIYLLKQWLFYSYKSIFWLHVFHKSMLPGINYVSVL